MDLSDKLRILSGAAKYDVSCSSSGSKRGSAKGALGSTSEGGICHSFTPDGRCISLLKILLTNYCIYDCAYCINRRTNDVERAAFSVEEVISLTMIISLSVIASWLNVAITFSPFSYNSFI